MDSDPRGLLRRGVLIGLASDGGKRSPNVIGLRWQVNHTTTIVGVPHSVALKIRRDWMSGILPRCHTQGLR